MSTLVQLSDGTYASKVITVGADGTVPATGGEAVTVVDGGDVTQGAKADAAYAGSGSASVIAALKGLYAAMVAATPAGTNLLGFVSTPTTISATVTRPADTIAYAANDCWSDSTSAPTSGGFTLTGMSRASGGSGVIRDAVITSSADPATTLQGEIWIFDTSVTAVNDNAAFALSDADVLKLVCVIPFTLATTVAGSGTNSASIITNINKMFTCVGSANLRFLVKVKNAYTPISGEVLQVRLGIEQMS